ncbi:MAG: ORF6N domain-containing protein [Nitrococcus mobilis]|nr:ORF6N domain-containing protein [Nitrococcus mobilis]
MKVQPFHYGGREVMTLRQLDQLNGVPKGTSFRAFKRVRPYLEEGMDFFCLTAHEHSKLSEALRQSGALYRTSVSMVLVTRRGYERMQQGI